MNGLTERVSTMRLIELRPEHGQERIAAVKSPRSCGSQVAKEAEQLGSA
jgi:hypothetical protein